MKYVLLVLALLAAAFGAFMYLGTSSKTVQQLKQQVAVMKVGHAPPIRELAPDTLFSYTEARDLATNWERLSASDSWADVEESNVLHVMARQPRIRAFLDTVMEVSEKIEYDVTTENVMKFVGEECGLGLALNPGGGEPDILLLTRLNVAALAQDMTRNTTLTDADWKVLQEELNKRTGQVDFQVTTQPVGDYELAICVRSDVTLYSTLIEDVLVFTTSEALARATLAARAGAGAGTLSTLPAFTSEMARLDADAPLASWVHIAYLESERTLLEKNCNAMDAAARDAEETPNPEEYVVPSYLVISEVLGAVEGAPAFAWATHVPEGDLYALDWTLSRTSAELFADKVDVTPSQAVPPGGVAYLEMRDIPGIVRAWDRSAAKRHLMESALVRKAEELAGDEATLRALSEGRPPPGLGGGMPGEEQSGGGADEPTLKGRFLPRFGWNVFSKQLGTLLGETMATSIHWDPQQSNTPVISGVMELGVAGRLAMIAGLAYERHRGDADTRVVEHRGRHLMLEARGDDTFCMAIVGDAMVFTNSDAAVRTTMDRALEPAAGAVPAHAAAARLGFPDTHRMLLHVDGARLRDALARMSTEETSGFGEDEAGLLQKAFSFESYVVAVDVDDAFSRVDLHYGAGMDEETNSAVRELLSGMPARSPASWALLSDRPFYVATNNIELSLYFNMIRDWMPDRARAEMNDGLSEIDETLGMSLVEDVLPAFGPELTLAMTYHAAPEPPPGAPPGAQPPAVPGIVFMLQVRDYDTVKRFIDRLVELGNEASRDRYQGRPGFQGGDAPDIMVHTPHNGVDVITLALTDEERADLGVDVSPALAVVGEFVVLSVHEDDVHRAIDLASGAGSSFVASDIVRRAAGDGIDLAGSSASLIDWNTAIDQLAEYDTMMAGFVPGAEEPDFPEYPADGDQEEWQRRIEKYQAESLAAREKAAEQVGGYLDSFRIVQYIAGTSRVKGDHATARLMVRFID